MTGGAGSRTGGAGSRTGGAGSRTGGAGSRTGGAGSRTGGAGSRTGGSVCNVSYHIKDIGDIYGLSATDPHLRQRISIHSFIFQLFISIFTF